MLMSRSSTNRKSLLYWVRNSTNDAPWIAVEFLDTDCYYCKESGAQVGEWAKTYSAEQWIGPDVIFIAIAVEFVSDSSRAEIVEFQVQERSRRSSNSKDFQLEPS